MVRNLGLTEFWIAFSTGNNFRYIPALGREEIQRPASVSFNHRLWSNIIICRKREEKCMGSKAGIWSLVRCIWHAFGYAPSLETLQDVLPLLEHFIVIMHDCSSICTYHNEVREDLFARKGRSIEAIPPTADAFLKHTKRVVYQAAYRWAQCLSPLFNLPSPSQWGWHKQEDEKWKLIWITLEPASVACQELLKCGCKQENGCSSRCKCRKADLPCTALCNRGDECDYVDLSDIS